MSHSLVRKLGTFNFPYSYCLHWHHPDKNICITLHKAYTFLAVYQPVGPYQVCMTELLHYLTRKANVSYTLLHINVTSRWIYCQGPCLTESVQKIRCSYRPSLVGDRSTRSSANSRHLTSDSSIVRPGGADCS
jgi:hypothetical protein